MQKLAIVASLIIGLLSLFVQSRPAPKQAAISAVSAESPPAAVQQPQWEPAETNAPAEATILPAGASLPVALPLVVPAYSETQIAMIFRGKEARERFALDPFAVEDSLMRCAQDYANFQARTGRRGHFANGDPEDRASAAGFKHSLRTIGVYNPRTRETAYGLGEVCADGVFQSVPAVFQAWLDSKVGHREALLESTYDLCGYGYGQDSRGQMIFVGMFGNSKVPAERAGALTATGGAAAVTRYQSCGPNGCGNIGRFRIFGRRSTHQQSPNKRPDGTYEISCEP